MNFNEIIGKYRNAFNSSFNQAPFSEKKAAEFFGISQRTLSNYRKDSKLSPGEHYYFVGKQLRYDINSLIEFFKKETENKLRQSFQFTELLTKLGEQKFNRSNKSVATAFLVTRLRTAKMSLDLVLSNCKI